MAHKNDVNIEEVLKGKMRKISDYPVKGVTFIDLTPIIKDKDIFKLTVDELSERLKDQKMDYIAAIEARGFIFGAALAYKMGIGFVPIRKKGKLPYKKVSREYMLEYGKETIEMHVDAIEKGSRVLIFDDLLATGGTAKATAEMIESVGGKVTGYAFVVELTFLNGRKKLNSQNIISIVKY